MPLSRNHAILRKESVHNFLAPNSGMKTKTIRLFIDKLLSETNQQVNPDFQFCYELMGSEGICVVPLSGFGSDLNGFRMTLLQEDDEVFTETLDALCRGIEQYYA